MSSDVSLIACTSSPFPLDYMYYYIPFTCVYAVITHKYMVTNADMIFFFGSLQHKSKNFTCLNDSVPLFLVFFFIIFCKFSNLSDIKIGLESSR